MTIAPHRNRVPDVLLERLAQGELTTEALRAAGWDTDDLPERQAALEADNAAFLAAHPPALEVPAIRRRAAGAQPARSRNNARFALWLMPPLAAAGLFVALRSETAAPQAYPPPAVAASDDGDTVRFKGEPQLLIHRQVGTGVAEALHPGDTAGAGDRLQLSYVPAGARYGVVVSLDGRGEVTLHSPAGPDADTALPPGPAGSASALPHAYELDDAPAFERFFWVTADAPLSAAQVEAAVRRLAGTPGAQTAPLALPAGQKQTSFLIHKAP